MYSQATQEQIIAWRTKARDGTLTREEMKQAIDILRADRKRAGETSAKSKTKKAATAAKKDIDSDGLLDELAGL
jgi:hypothetical protein